MNFKSFLKNKKLTPKKILKIIRLVAIGAAIVVVGFFAAFAAVAEDLPDPNRINSRVVAESSKIFDRNGELLYEIHGEVKRTLIPFEEMPDSIKHATIAIEDKDFYNHRGIDFRGILRAAFRDVTQGRTEGGSSITQQLVKNALLYREKTLARKFKELILTIQIERRLSKDDILKLYLNEIPYGRNAYGIEAAAQTYFGKRAKELTLAESAYLAALPQRPSYFNSHREELDARKDYILNRMAELGYISQEEAKAAQQAEVVFNTTTTNIKAPHFVIYVQGLLEERYGEQALQEGGFEVTTTLDYKLQQIAEKAIADNADRFERYGATNASLVAIDPRNGDILAMVGSRDFFDEEHRGQVNAAMRPLQPGSSFKPYVYAAAFEEGMSPATMLLDVRTVFGVTGSGEPYSPQNYNGREHGPVSIRQALAGSLNIPAVKTLYLVGIRDAINMAKKLGITSPLSTDVCGLSLVLGGCEVELLDHTSAFGVFANGGIRHEPRAILKIENSQGEIVFEQREEEGQEVISPEVAYLITDILSDNAARAFVFGVNNFLALPDRPVAAKTGTTQEWKDAWTVGYVPQMVAGVWVGNMDGTKMNAGADGSVVAAPIWNAFMREALKDVPREEFKKPQNIVEVEVEKLSGLLPGPYTPSGETKIEKFIADNVPTEEENIHTAVKVNRLNGLLATTDTPPELIETRIYTILHSERPEDPDWENPVRNWAVRNGYIYPPTQKDGQGDIINNSPNSFTYKLNLISPAANTTINGPTTIRVEVSSALNADDIEIFLRDKQGFSLKLVGSERLIYLDSQTNIYELNWTPTPDLAADTYSLFASLPSGQKSNLVNINIP